MGAAIEKHTGRGSATRPPTGLLLSIGDLVEYSKSGGGKGERGEGCRQRDDRADTQR